VERLMAKIKIRHQPRFPGGRIPVNGRLIPKAEEFIREEARRYRCSKSWIASFYILIGMGRSNEVLDYREDQRPIRKKRK
jgi:hypothetical protein